MSDGLGVGTVTCHQKWRSETLSESADIGDAATRSRCFKVRGLALRRFTVMDPGALACLT